VDHYAVFDMNDHAIVPGWATYHLDTPAHPHLPAAPPSPDPKGYRPDEYAKCACGAAFKWYRIGQHRYGSIDADR
jgi:hypothetical protein